MQHLSEIVEEARKKGKKRLAVAYGQDAHTLAAVYAAYKEGLVEPILFGDPKIIEQVCKEENIDCNIFKIIPESNDVKCVNLAVNAVVTGEADVLMKGLVSTDKYMRGILNKDAGLFPPKGTLSHVAVVEMPNYPKLLVISDVAVIPQPDFKQKTILIGYLTRIANLIGIKTPKIACIAPSEQLLPSVLSSTEAALLAKMGDRGQLGNVVIDGPLSLDVALYKEAAEIGGVFALGVHQVVLQSCVYFIYARFDRLDQTAATDHGREGLHVEVVLCECFEYHLLAPVELVDDARETCDLLGRMAQGERQRRLLVVIQGDLRRSRARVDC